MHSGGKTLRLSTFDQWSGRWDKSKGNIVRNWNWKGIEVTSLKVSSHNTNNKNSALGTSHFVGSK